MTASTPTTNASVAERREPTPTGGTSHSRVARGETLSKTSSTQTHATGSAHHHERRGGAEGRSPSSAPHAMWAEAEPRGRAQSVPVPSPASTHARAQSFSMKPRLRQHSPPRAHRSH